MISSERGKSGSVQPIIDVAGEEALAKETSLDDGSHNRPVAPVAAAAAAALPLNSATNTSMSTIEEEAEFSTELPTSGNGKVSAAPRSRRSFRKRRPSKASDTSLKRNFSQENVVKKSTEDDETIHFPSDTGIGSQ